MPRGALDHARHTKAKQAVAQHHDGLLKRANRSNNWSKVLNDNKGKSRMLAIGTGLNMGSMIAYVPMIIFWFRVYHTSFAWTVIMYCFLLVLALFMFLYSQKRIAGIERPWLSWLGCFFALAATAGLFVGFFLYFKSLAYYYRYQELRPYTNVGAAQSADAFADASMFLWTEDTFLDAPRSVGYKSKWTGETYCVAPIVDGTMGGTDPIRYWAVGENCCNQRGAFWCDDAKEATVRSALVILEPEDVVRPFMEWAVQGAAYPRYERALALQEATFSTKAAMGELKLVTWSKDPVAAKDAYYDNAKNKAVWVSLVYFFFSEILACFVAAKFILVPRKLEGVFRESMQMQSQQPHPGQHP